MTMPPEAYYDHMKRTIVEIEQEVSKECSPAQIMILTSLIMRVGEGVRDLGDKLGTASSDELKDLMISTTDKVMALQIELRWALEAATSGRRGIMHGLAQLVNWRRQG